MRGALTKCPEGGDLQTKFGNPVVEPPSGLAGSVQVRSRVRAPVIKGQQTVLHDRLAWSERNPPWRVPEQPALATWPGLGRLPAHARVSVFGKDTGPATAANTGGCLGRSSQASDRCPSLCPRTRVSRTAQHLSPGSHTEAAFRFPSLRAVFACIPLIGSGLRCHFRAATPALRMARTLRFRQAQPFPDRAVPAGGTPMRFHAPLAAGERPSPQRQVRHAAPLGLR